jgi:hypothetical protein
VPDYLRAQIERLSFGPGVHALAQSGASVPTVSSRKQSLAKIPLRFAPILLPEPENRENWGEARDPNLQSLREVEYGRGERIRTSGILLPNRSRNHHRRSQPFATVENHWSPDRRARPTV